MKRNKHGRPTVIDWKYCFICRGKQKDITDSEDTLKSMAGNITEYKSLCDELDLEWDAIIGTHTTLYESLKKQKFMFPQELRHKV